MHYDTEDLTEAILPYEQLNRNAEQGGNLRGVRYDIFTGPAPDSP